MSHEITPYDHYVSGDSIRWTFDIEADGSAKALGSATVDYMVLSDERDSDSEAIVDDGDSSVDVTVEPNGETGRIRVDIDPGAITRGGELLWHRLRVTDGSGGRRTYGGEFFVNIA